MHRNNAAETTMPVVAFPQCVAKTYARDGGAIVPGRHVPNHCRIVGEVARALLKRWPTALAASLFPPGSALAAACHDIGKVSPTFQEKLRRACTADIEDWPILPVNPALEKMWGGHAGVSQLAARAVGAPRYVPEILGEHHGFSPPVAGKRATDEAFGGAAWQAQRAALVEDLKSQLHVDWPQVESAAQARLLAGLTSVADWIGSGRFFENPTEPWQDKIERAIDDAGFIAPVYRAGLCFANAFGFAPRAVQQTFIDTVTSPGVYVLEAPMGVGKTEAALFAAYHLLVAQRATGIYFALPTQLTSNKIHERFNAFLSTILAPDCRHRAWLLHSKAWLIDTEMGEEGRPGGAWFNQAK
ncbi:MAG: CRISPR-associated endonuclease Cas3'' [Terriglobales bacterium]